MTRLAVSIRSADLVLVGEVSVKLIAIISPGDLLLVECVADVAHARRWNREHIVVRVGICVSVGAVAEVTRIVVVEKIECPFSQLDLTLRSSELR